MTEVWFLAYTCALIICQLLLLAAIAFPILFVKRVAFSSPIKIRPHHPGPQALSSPDGAKNLNLFTRIGPFRPGSDKRLERRDRDGLVVPVRNTIGVPRSLGRFFAID
jgi:hypothetical protein